MNNRYGISVENPLFKSFEFYLNDHHGAQDLITSLTTQEARALLRACYQAAPHAVSKVMALDYPWNQDEAERVETIIQGQLALPHPWATHAAGNGNHNSVDEYTSCPWCSPTLRSTPKDAPDVDGEST